MVPPSTCLRSSFAHVIHGKPASSLSVLCLLNPRYTKCDRERESCSVMSDSLQPRGLYSPRNSLGQNTGVGSLSPDNQALRPAVKPVIALSVLFPAYTKPGSQCPLPRWLISMGIMALATVIDQGPNTSDQSSYKGETLCKLHRALMLIRYFNYAIFSTCLY